jgi:hypothetical protein
MTRQQDGCPVDVSDHIFGTKGVCDVMKHKITGANPWSGPPRKRGEGVDMYQQEHVELFASIRDGKPINDGERMAYSTLMAIMGRMATYTGQIISWDDALKSKEDLSPSSYTFGPLKVSPVAVPGVTAFV